MNDNFSCFAAFFIIFCYNISQKQFLIPVVICHIGTNLLVMSMRNCGTSHGAFDRGMICKDMFFLMFVLLQSGYTPFHIFQCRQTQLKKKTRRKRIRKVAWWPRVFSHCPSHAHSGSCLPPKRLVVRHNRPKPCQSAWRMCKQSSKSNGPQVAWAWEWPQ